jgi:hypothetical protein
MRRAGSSAHADFFRTLPPFPDLIPDRFSAIVAGSMVLPEQKRIPE